MEEKKVLFGSLYDEHADAIFRYLAYRLGDRERAKELTQEVFMRLWRHLAAGKPVEYEKAFLYTIAKRLFINDIRGAAAAYSLEATEDATGFEPVDTSQNLQTSAELSELWDLVATLPPATAELLRLRYQDGLSVEDIATLFDAKQNTISMRISRAIEHLKKIYRPHQDPTI